MALKNPELIGETATSTLFKVQRDGKAAVLKIFTPLGIQSESCAANALRHFQGKGAVSLLDSDQRAHLLEYIDGPTLFAKTGKDKNLYSVKIVCQVLAKLHVEEKSLPGLQTMEKNFQSLFNRVENGSRYDLLIDGVTIAKKLISSTPVNVVLHGDIHHENIMLCSEFGWLAIDPKGLVGERTYDTANFFYNPNSFVEELLNLERIWQVATTFAEALDLSRQRILEFAFAYGCLSACWDLEDGREIEKTLQIARVIKTFI